MTISDFLTTGADLLRSAVCSHSGRSRGNVGGRHGFSARIAAAAIFALAATAILPANNAMAQIADSSYTFTDNTDATFPVGGSATFNIQIDYDHRFEGRWLGVNVIMGDTTTLGEIDNDRTFQVETADFTISLADSVNSGKDCDPGAAETTTNHNCVFFLTKNVNDDGEGSFKVMLPSGNIRTPNGFRSGLFISGNAEVTIPLVVTAKSDASLGSIVLTSGDARQFGGTISESGVPVINGGLASGIAASVPPSTVTYTIVETTATLARTRNNDAKSSANIPRATGVERTFSVALANLPAEVSGTAVARVRLRLLLEGGDFSGVDTSDLDSTVCPDPDTGLCAWNTTDYQLEVDVGLPTAAPYRSIGSNGVIFVDVPYGNLASGNGTVTFTLSTLGLPTEGDELDITLTGVGLRINSDGGASLDDIISTGDGDDQEITYFVGGIPDDGDARLDERNPATIGGVEIDITEEAGIGADDVTGTVTISNSATATVFAATRNPAAEFTGISVSRTGGGPIPTVDPVTAVAGVLTRELGGLAPGEYEVIIDVDSVDDDTRTYTITLRVMGVGITPADIGDLLESDRAVAGEGAETFTISLAGIDLTNSGGNAVDGVRIGLQFPAGRGGFAEHNGANVIWRSDLFELDFPDTGIGTISAASDIITFIAATDGNDNIPIAIRALSGNPAFRSDDYSISIESAVRVTGTTVVGDPITARPSEMQLDVVPSADPTVAIVTADAVAREGDTANTGEFTITLTNIADPDVDVVIPYAFSGGTADFGAAPNDFTARATFSGSPTPAAVDLAASGTLTVPSGAIEGNANEGTGTVTITVTASDDDAEENTGRETVRLDLDTPTAPNGIALDPADGIPTNDITIADNDFVDVCFRTEHVRAALIAATSVATCELVTAALMNAIAEGVTVSADQSGATLRINGSAGPAVNFVLGDLDDLTNVKIVNMQNNGLTTLPENIFRDMALLERIIGHASSPNANNIGRLTAAVFNGPTALKRIALPNNTNLEFANNALDRVLPTLDRLTITNSGLKRYANFDGTEVDVVRAGVTVDGVLQDGVVTIPIKLETTAAGGTDGTLPVAAFIPVTITAGDDTNVTITDGGVVIPAGGSGSAVLTITALATSVDGNRTLTIGEPVLGVITGGDFTPSAHEDRVTGGEAGNIVHESLVQEGSTTTRVATLAIGEPTDATLDRLTLTSPDAVLAPPFVDGTEGLPSGYTATFEAGTPGFTVTANAAPDDGTTATVTSITAIRDDTPGTVILGAFTAGPPATNVFTGLTHGAHTITVTVDRERGDDVEYVINATIEAFTDAALSDLVAASAGPTNIPLARSGTTNTVFAADVSAYTASVANSVTSVTVTPTADASGTYAVTATGLTGGDNQAAVIPLDVGDTTVTIAVTSQSGVLRPTPYTIVFTRARALARLSLTPTAPVASPEEFATNLNVPGAVAIEVEHGTTDATLSITASDTAASTTISTPVATLPLTVSEFLTTTNTASATFANIDGNSNVFTFTINSAGTVATEYTVTITWGSAGGAGGYEVSLGGNASVPADTTAATSIDIALSDIPYSVTNSRGADADLIAVHIPLKVQFGASVAALADAVLSSISDSTVTSDAADITIQLSGTGASARAVGENPAPGEFSVRVPVSALATRPRRGDTRGEGDISLSITTTSIDDGDLPRAVRISSNGRLVYELAARDGDADPVGGLVSAATDSPDDPPAFTPPAFTIRKSDNTLSALTAGGTEAGGFGSGDGPGTYEEVALAVGTESVPIVATPTVTGAHVLVCDFNDEDATSPFTITATSRLNVAVYVTPASNPNPHTDCDDALAPTDAGNRANRVGRGVYRFPVRALNPRAELTRVLDGDVLSNTANAEASVFAVTMHDVPSEGAMITIGYTVATSTATCVTDYAIDIVASDSRTISMAPSCTDSTPTGIILIPAPLVNANVFQPASAGVPILISITPTGTADDGETIALSLTGVTTTGIAVDVDTADVESVRLDGNRPPTVMIEPAATAMEEGPVAGVLNVTVNRGVGSPAATGADAEITFTRSGTATDVTDYVLTVVDVAGVPTDDDATVTFDDDVGTLMVPFDGTEQAVVGLTITPVDDIDPENPDETVDETVIITLTGLSFGTGTEAPVGAFDANDILAMGGNRGVITIDDNDRGALLIFDGTEDDLANLAETESFTFTVDLNAPATSFAATPEAVKAGVQLSFDTAGTFQIRDEIFTDTGGGSFTSNGFNVDVSGPGGAEFRLATNGSVRADLPRVDGAVNGRLTWTVTANNVSGRPYGAGITVSNLQALNANNDNQGSASDCAKIINGIRSEGCQINVGTIDATVTHTPRFLQSAPESAWRSQSGAALTTEAGLNARIAERSETSVTRVLALDGTASPNTETVDVTFSLGGDATFGDDYTLDIIDAVGDPVRSAGGGVFAPDPDDGGTFRLPASAANNSVSFVVVAVTDAATVSPVDRNETVVIRVTGIRTSGGAEVAVPEVNGFTATIADYGTFPTARLEARNGAEGGAPGEFTLTLENAPDFDATITYQVDTAPGAGSYTANLPVINNFFGTFATAADTNSTLIIPARAISSGGDVIARIGVEVANGTIASGDQLDIVLTISMIEFADANTHTDISPISGSPATVSMVDNAVYRAELSLNGNERRTVSITAGASHRFSIDTTNLPNVPNVAEPVVCYSFTGTAIFGTEYAITYGADDGTENVAPDTTETACTDHDGALEITQDPEATSAEVVVRIDPDDTSALAVGDTIIMELFMPTTGAGAAVAINPPIADRTITVTGPSAEVTPTRAEITASDGVEGGDSGSFRIDLFDIPDDEPINVRAVVLDDGDPAVSHYVIRTVTDDGNFNSDLITPTEFGRIEFTAANADAVTIEIDPVDDDADTVSEVVTLAIERISFGDDSETGDDISGENRNLPGPATLRIQDNDVTATTSAVFIAEKAVVSEGGEGKDSTGSFLLTLDLPNAARDPSSAGVEIDFTVSGTAIAPMDLIEVDAVADLTDYILYAEYTGANDVLVRVGPDISAVINAGDLGNIEGVSAAFDRNFVAATTAGVASGKLTIPLADLSAVEEVRFFVAPQDDSTADEGAETVILQIDRISADGPTNGTAVELSQITVDGGPATVNTADATRTVSIIDADSSPATPIAWMVPTETTTLVEDSARNKLDTVHVATVSFRNIPATARSVLGNIIFRDSNGLAAMTDGGSSPLVAGTPSPSLNIVTGSEDHRDMLDFAWNGVTQGRIIDVGRAIVLGDDTEFNGVNGGHVCANRASIANSSGAGVGNANIYIFMRAGNDFLPQGPKEIHMELTNVRTNTGGTICAPDTTGPVTLAAARTAVVTLIDDGDSADPAVSVASRRSTIDESPSSTNLSANISGYDLVIGNEGGPDEPDDVPDGAGITEVIFTLTEETTNPTATSGAARDFNRGGVMTSYSPLSRTQNLNPGVPDFTIVGDSGKTIYYSADHDEYAIFFAENERNAADDTLSAGFTITAVEDDYDESLGNEGLFMIVKSVRYVGLDMAFSIDPAAGRGDSITSRDGNNTNNDDGNGSVNFTGGNGTVDEEGETAITRNLDITGVDPNQFVDVRFTLGAGTRPATLNTDYGLVIRDGRGIRVLNTAGSPFEPTANGGTFRLPAGAANRASFTITAYADNDNDTDEVDGETVMITVAAINSLSGGGDTGFTGTATLTATIDNDAGTPPTASLISGDAIEACAEAPCTPTPATPATDGYFELTLENAPNLDAIVDYRIVSSSDAPGPAFYTTSLEGFTDTSTLTVPASARTDATGTLVIPASAADEIMARILIHALVDGPDITGKSVALTIRSIMFEGTVGGVNRITAIAGSPASVAIIEGNKPTATLMRMSPESLPENAAGATFMVAFSNLPDDSEQVLGCTLTSDALYGDQPGQDYTLMPAPGTNTMITEVPAPGAPGGDCEITVATGAFGEVNSAGQPRPGTGVYAGMGGVRIVPTTDSDTSEEPEPILLRLVGSTDLAAKNPPIARSRVNIVEEVRSSARLSPPTVSVDEGGSTDITVTVHPGGGDLASSGWADVGFSVSGSGRTVTVVPGTESVSRITASGFRLDDGDGDVIIRVASTPNSISANQDITVTLTGLEYESHLGTPAAAGRLNTAGLAAIGGHTSTITVVNNGVSTLAMLQVDVGGTPTDVTGFAASTLMYNIYVAPNDSTSSLTLAASGGAAVLVCDAVPMPIPLDSGEYDIGAVGDTAVEVKVHVTAATRVDPDAITCANAEADTLTTTTYTLSIATVPTPTGTTAIGNAPVGGAENVPDVRDNGDVGTVPIDLSGFPDMVRVGTALVPLTHVDVPIDTGGLSATASLLASGAIEYVNTSATTVGYEGDYTITPIGATVQSASDSGFVLRVPVDDGGARPNLLITTLNSAGDNDDVEVTFTPQTTGYSYIVDDGNDTPGDDSPPVGASDFDNLATDDIAFIIRAAGNPHAMITTVTSGRTVAEGAVKEFLVTLTGVDSGQRVIIPWIIDASAASAATWSTDDTMGDYTMAATLPTTTTTPTQSGTTISGQITIPAGETTGRFRIVARDDSGDANPVDPGETIALGFDTRSTSGIEPSNLGIGPLGTFNLTIVEDATAEISAPTSIDEGTTGNVTVMIDRGPILSTEPATVTFTVTPGDENTTTRDYAITDNTDNGRDVSTGGTFTIPMGATEGVLTFRARDDDVIDPRETVTITVTSVQFTGLTGESAALDDHLALGVFTPDSAMVTINNTDAGASISAPTPATIREVASTAPDPVLMTASTFRVTIASPPSAGRATTITLTLGSGPLYGNADPNDYVIETTTAGVMLTEPNAGANGGTLTALIPAGRITAGTDFPVDFTVTATNDMQRGEPAETIRITLTDIDDATNTEVTNDFSLESPTTHTITLIDDDVVVRAGLSGDISIGEKARGEGTITLSLSPAPLRAFRDATVTFTLTVPATADDNASGIPTPLTSGDASSPMPELADYIIAVDGDVEGHADSFDIGDFDLTGTEGTVSGTLRLGEGVSSASFTFMALDDDRREGNEVVGLTITGLTFDSHTIASGTGAAANVTITEVSGEDVMRETQMITHVVGKEQVNLVTGLVRQRVSALTLGSPQGFSEPGVQLALAENPQTIQDFFSQMALESSGEMDDGGAFAIWAKGQYIEISGSPDVAGQDNFEYEGKIAGIGMGMEKRFSQSLVGLSMNFSTADIDSKSDMRAEGNYKETMTFFAPYAAWKPDNSRLTLWGTAGAGFGSAEITGGEDHGEGNPSVQAFFAQGGVDLSENLGKTAEVVFGMSAVVIEKSIDAWSAGALNVPGTESSVFQAQADATAYFPVYSDDGQVLRPYVGLASVHDVGDVTNDDRHAMEVQTGIAWSNGPWQVSFDTFYQFLRDDEEAWGVFGEAQWSGTGDLDGLLMGVTSGHGTASSMSDAASSTDSVNSDIDTNLANADTETAEWSIQTNSEYGFAAPVVDRNGRATPFFRSTHSADAQSFVSGMRMDVTDNIGVTAESNRHIPADDDPYSEHAVGLEARWEF